MRYTLAMAGFLAVFWLANSGHYDALLLGMGALSVLVVSWISHRMDVVDHESIPLHLFFKLPRYLAWLVGQIFLSNLDLVRRVWRPSRQIDPMVARVPLPQHSDVCRVVYANSINLTPGTLTIDMEADTLLVHTLSHEGMHALQSGEMARRVSELEQ